MPRAPRRSLRWAMHGFLLLAFAQAPIIGAAAALDDNTAAVKMVRPPAEGVEARLGRVDFPTSGTGAAQEHFLRGVATLHSFWYDEALEWFRESTKADPSFVMGYWGEAMAHNHPIWYQQDTEAARKVLQKIKDKDVEKLTPRERAYVDAVRILYGDGEKLSRDQAYASAMEKIYREYPNDLEAATFYALSLLGTVRLGDKGYRRQMQAGAIALEVYGKNPDHPGAAHYIIHSFDDPEHAILALPAAKRYAEIAPAAHHARHMPSHIFLQLGMWPEAAASNESAWSVSDAWVKRKGLASGRRDYHSYHWLFYIYLQQGRYTEAERLLATLRADLKEAAGDSTMERSFNSLAATYIVETQRWDQTTRFFPATAAGPGLAGRQKTGATEEADHCTTAKNRQTGRSPQGMSGKSAGDSQPRRQNLRIFSRGLAAAMQGSPTHRQSLNELRAQRKKHLESGEHYAAQMVEIMELEIEAAASAAKGDYKLAIARLKRATALEENLSPPSGPPDLLKPSHELLGEILLQAGRPSEAAEQFDIALRRQPNRARSLLGSARSALQKGDRKASLAAYSRLLQIWDRSDQDLLERQEAARAFDQASVR